MSFIAGYLMGLEEGGAAPPSTNPVFERIKALPQLGDSLVLADGWSVELRDWFSDTNTISLEQRKNYNTASSGSQYLNELQLIRRPTWTVSRNGVVQWAEFEDGYGWTAARYSFDQDGITTEENVNTVRIENININYTYLKRNTLLNLNWYGKKFTATDTVGTTQTGDFFLYFNIDSEAMSNIFTDMTREEFLAKRQELHTACESSLRVIN